MDSWSLLFNREEQCRRWRLRYILKQNIALQKIKEIYDRGNIPIIVGGTGFYIDSLLYKYNLPNISKD